MTAAPIIFGFQGLRLSEAERGFFREVRPWGYILFARNIENPKQVRALTDSLRELHGDDRLPILIDQEGGRVARLGGPHWPPMPPASVLGDAALAYRHGRVLAGMLAPLGINVDCAPLADLRLPGMHDIIGNRSFGEYPEQVAQGARAQAEGLLAGGVLPVLKHIPGHGRARADSHFELPVVKETLEVLEATDFAPFKALADLPLGMTAHITFTALDAELPATLSPKAMGYIREQIGIEGAIMSDDLSMKALDGWSFGERSAMALAAGCDLLLHCNGEMGEMQQVAAAAGVLEGDALRRCERALGMLRTADDFNFEAEYAALIAATDHATA